MVTQIKIPGLPEVEKQKELTPEQKCKAGGGFWDAERQVCLTIDPKTKEQFTPTQKTGELVDVTPPGTRKDLPKGGTPIPGAVGGAEILTDARGETYIVNPTDAAKLKGQQEGTTQGSAPGTFTSQADILQQKQIQEGISNIGTVGSLQEAQQAEVNKSQAFAAGTLGNLGTVLRNAGAGVAAGALVGGPLGAIAFGIGGAAQAILGGYIANVKEQQRGELGAANQELAAARTNMRQFAMLASQDPARADEYIRLYNAQLTRIHQARRQTAAEVAGDLNAWMEDGREQLAAFDTFLQAGGTADVYGQKLRVALQTDTPLAIIGDEIFLQGEENGI